MPGLVSAGHFFFFALKIQTGRRALFHRLTFGGGYKAIAKMGLYPSLSVVTLQEFPSNVGQDAESA